MIFQKTLSNFNNLKKKKNNKPLGYNCIGSFHLLTTYPTHNNNHRYVGRDLHNITYR